MNMSNEANEFDECVKYEKTQQPIADNYYIRLYGNRNELIRYDWDDPSGQYMQRKGIDCSVIDRNQQPPKLINISEKFRRNDWGDMMIEIYSSYPKTFGWGITDHDVDLYAYFIDPESYRRRNSDPRDPVYGKVYEIKAETVHKIAAWAKEQFDNSDWGDRWLESKSNKKIVFPPTNEMPPIIYIKTYSKRDGRNWMGISICIEWGDIKKYFGEVKENITVDINHL